MAYSHLRRSALRGIKSELIRRADYAGMIQTVPDDVRFSDRVALQCNPVFYSLSKGCCAWNFQQSIHVEKIASPNPFIVQKQGVWTLNEMHLYLWRKMLCLESLFSDNMGSVFMIFCGDTLGEIQGLKCTKNCAKGILAERKFCIDRIPRKHRIVNLGF